MVSVLYSYGHKVDSYTYDHRIEMTNRTLERLRILVYPKDYFDLHVFRVLCGLNRLYVLNQCMQFYCQLKHTMAVFTKGTSHVSRFSVLYKNIA